MTRILGKGIQLHGTHYQTDIYVTDFEKMSANTTWAECTNGENVPKVFGNACAGSKTSV